MASLTLPLPLPRRKLVLRVPEGSLPVLGMPALSPLCAPVWSFTLAVPGAPAPPAALELSASPAPLALSVTSVVLPLPLAPAGAPRFDVADPPGWVDDPRLVTDSPGAEEELVPAAVRKGERLVDAWRVPGDFAAETLDEDESLDELPGPSDAPVSAHAVPWWAKMAAPIPRATARPPTRPTFVEDVMETPLFRAVIADLST